jgi:hypothetical protein
VYQGLTCKRHSTEHTSVNKNKRCDQLDFSAITTTERQQNKIIDSSHAYTDERKDSKKGAAVNSFHYVGWRWCASWNEFKWKDDVIYLHYHIALTEFQPRYANIRTPGSILTV